MTPIQPENPRSPHGSVPAGIVFGVAAAIWAAALFFVNFRDVTSAHSQEQSVISASTLPANSNPSTAAVRDNTKTPSSPASNEQKAVVHFHSKADAFKNPEFKETIHWNVTQSDTGMLPLSEAKSQSPVTVQLRICKEAGGKYQWIFAAVNRSDTPWRGQIRIFLLAPTGTAHVEDFTIDTPLEPEQDIATNYGVTLHAFETDAAPQIEGGTITAYGYSTVDSESSYQTH